jgi:hypothetical protein
MWPGQTRVQEQFSKIRPWAYHDGREVIGILARSG